MGSLSFSPTDSLHKSEIDLRQAQEAK